MDDNILLKVENLKKEFNVGNKQVLKAVDGITFSLAKGKTLGVVGESGCGKSTLGKTIIHLYDPSSGKIVYKNEDISHIKKNKLIELSTQIQMIFQDPYSSLNPRMTVGDIICEGFDIRKQLGKEERKYKTRRVVPILLLHPPSIDIG